MAEYERWLGQAELSVLRLLGLFNRPIPQNLLAALRFGAPIEGLTHAIVELGDPEWWAALRRLREARLINPMEHPFERGTRRASTYPGVLRSAV
jgi:hypothetical protein